MSSYDTRCSSMQSRRRSLEELAAVRRCGGALLVVAFLETFLSLKSYWYEGDDERCESHDSRVESMKLRSRQRLFRDSTILFYPDFHDSCPPGKNTLLPYQTSWRSKHLLRAGLDKSPFSLL
jgi:hypothetical protein